MSVNVFVNLPAPAANGAGAAVNVSTLAPGKSIVVAGVWPTTANPIITVEINNDAVPNGSWSALASIQGPGVVQVSAVARWMRVIVGNFTSGPAPQVDVGSVDDVPQFVNLAVPAGTDVGAAVDTSALGPLKTVTVGDAFRGSLAIEVSEDGVNNWATAMSFNQPGQQTKQIAAHWMRTRRSGVPVLSPGLPIVNVGGTFGASSGGGGGGGVDVQQAGVPVVTPAQTLNFTGPGATVTNSGGGVAQVFVGAAAPRTVTVANTPYNILATDDYLFVDTSGGPITLILPDPTTFTYAKEYKIIDSKGTFATNNLTLQPHAAEQIEGLAASKVFQTNWGGWTIVTDGTNWFVY